MHDLDRTQLEMESDEFEDEFESDDEYGDEFETDDYEADYETDDAENPFSEAEEMEFAAELLEVEEEYELDQFLGKLVHRLKRKTRRILPKSVRKSLGRILKRTVKTALPILKKKVEKALSGPGAAALGGEIDPPAGQLFGLELEGLSTEDQEYEVARRLVRLAGTAAKQAAMTPPTASPQAAAQQAVVKAAQKHAPGFLRKVAGKIPSVGSVRGHSGRWKRRGRKIILMGV